MKVAPSGAGGRPRLSSSMRIVSRRPLHYLEGADAKLDRPAHVRAGSGCCFIPGTRTLAVVQDDAHFLALVDVDTGKTRSITLPPGPGGLRQFDTERGNKKSKMDLEACAYIDDRIVLFGSGSTDQRERIVVVDPTTGASQIRDMHALYDALRRHPLMAGAELNIEGAVQIENGLRLFQRGNGAGAVNATFDVPWPLAPKILHAQKWELGEIEGVRLTFTDATKVNDQIIFLAAAEDSPNTYDDGVVVGCAIGFLEEPIRIQRIPFEGKPEGIASDPTRPGKVWLVTDRDDPSAPSELIELEM
jgi:hypothetical protein